MMLPRKLCTIHTLYHPALRQSTRLTSRQRRSFHNTPPTQFLEAVLLSIHDVLTGLHSITGLPWAATLPLTALLMRVCFVLPLQVANHRATQRQLDLAPLLNAWRQNLQRKVMADFGGQGPRHTNMALQRGIRAKRTELYQRWGCRRWKNWLPIAHFPIWLAVIETIRRMAGAGEGLLGWATSMVRDEGVNADRDTILDAISASAVVPVEASLADEGALWFPNLLLPDPTLVLPFVLSAALFTSVHLNTRPKAPDSVVLPPSVARKRMERAAKLIALAVGPLTLQVPSAIMVYWISGSVISIGEYYLRARLVPFRSPIPPCKPRAGGIAAEMVRTGR